MKKKGKSVTVRGPRVKKRKSALIEEFVEFGGDEEFLDRLKEYADDSHAPHNSYSKYSCPPRKAYEKMKEIKKNAFNFCKSLHSVAGCGDACLCKRIKPIEESFGRAIEKMKLGMSLVGRGGQVKNFKNYFWLSALVPYTHYVSGEPKWAWIKNYLNELYPNESGKEELARIKNSWKKMLRAVKRALAIVKQSTKVTTETHGLTYHFTSIAPDWAQCVLDTVHKGEMAYPSWRKYNKPPAKPKYFRIMKQYMTFLDRDSLWPYDKPKPLTKAHLAMTRSLGKQGVGMLPVLPPR